MVDPGKRAQPLLQAVERLDERVWPDEPWTRFDPAPVAAGVAPPRPTARRGGLEGLAELDALLAIIGEENRALNAFVHLTPEAAHDDLARALARSSGALRGVPIAHKDLFDVAGVPTRAGSRVRESTPAAERDATVVARLRRAGAVGLGKLSTHEFATGVTGQVCAGSAAVNPWDSTRVTGGSSSGSAVAVAAGQVVAATATDTGGSIRIPCACCGVTGLKPTFGRLPIDGVVPFSHSLDHVGVIAASTAVLRPVYAAAAEHAETAGPADDLRVGVLESWMRVADPRVAAAVRAAVATLGGFGARSQPVESPALWDYTNAVAACLFLTEGFAYHRDQLAHEPQAFQPPTRELLELGAAIPARRYEASRRARAALVRETLLLFERVDVLVGPAVAVAAPRIDASAVTLPTGPTDPRAALTLFTRLFNVVGLPVLTLPCGFVDGLPVALQLVGPPWSEADLLEIGVRFQSATDWVRRPPGRR